MFNKILPPSTKPSMGKSFIKLSWNYLTVIFTFTSWTILKINVLSRKLFILCLLFWNQIN